MFFLLTKMGQAMAMVVDLVESDWLGLLITIILVNALAFSLSHFPLYTYYAANLNNNEKFIKWRKVSLLRIIKFRVFKVEHDYEKHPNESYSHDLSANVFRYLNGFLVFAVWNYILFFGFQENMVFDGTNYGTTKLTVLVISLITFIYYGIIKNFKFKLKESEFASKTNKNVRYPKYTILQDRLNKSLAISLTIFSIIMMTALLTCLILVAMEDLSAFSKFGLFLLLIVNFMCLLIYFNFRLIRPDLMEIARSTKGLVGFYMKGLKFLSLTKNYLGLLYLFFGISWSVIIYSHLAIFLNWDIMNGIPILFANLYFYSFIIASISKYFFVTSNNLESHYEVNAQIKGQAAKRSWFAFALILVGISYFMGGSSETRLHELDQIETSEEDYKHSDTELIYEFNQREDSVVFFIANQGGGLKANFWTLNVLNHLQTITEGKLLSKTVAMSGASGGSLGIGLYTCLYREDGIDTLTIQDKIDTISGHNFTSMDLTMLFGWDLAREFWPFNKCTNNKNRSYYSQLQYQDYIEGRKNDSLSMESFRSVWNGAYRKDGYFPSLIMNTASTKGSRGVFWSHTTNEFENVFPFSENLADLKNGLTIPFYQAISTTNRFPLFSPAAKINGYGHFIDVGAIDNSGLLGCLDVYNHMQTKIDTINPFNNKRIVFIEIVNGKSKYVHHVLRLFEKKLSEKGEYIKYKEDESSNLAANFETGINLDKWPEYLADYMRVWEEKDDNFDYVEIMLPHRLTLDDFQTVIKGEIDSSLRSEFVSFIEEHNDQIRSYSNGVGFVFTEPWQYLEPTLARHLCDANIAFGKRAIEKDKLLQENFDEIKAFVNM